MTLAKDKLLEAIGARYAHVRLLAYWTTAASSDDPATIDVLRVLNVPENLLVEVDAAAYQLADSLLGDDWSFLIDVRREADSAPGGCYHAEYSRLRFSRALRHFALPGLNEREAADPTTWPTHHFHLTDAAAHYPSPQTTGSSLWHDHLVVTDHRFPGTLQDLLGSIGAFATTAWSRIDPELAPTLFDVDVALSLAATVQEHPTTVSANTHYSLAA